tara:strand:- start:1107 stop:2723 length:1617 start_codon:yes stop_codon:yes gene_type:complete
MPNLPIRDLGAVGVITDTDPFNLPFNAFTRAKNVRFVNNSVEHSPIFRDVLDVGTTDNPEFVHGLFTQDGYDTTLVVTDTFKILEMQNSTISTVYTGSQAANSKPYTACSLANVEYVNRTDTAPVYRTPTGVNFSVLSNFVPSSTCNSLRSYGDFLIALNMTESGVTFPTRVRFSDLALSNQIPSTWDASDLTNSAGFNDIVQMKTPIVDGLALNSNFFIYSSDQVWQMEFVGGAFIFNFRKIFDNCGVVNANCIVEHEGKHFVFDNDDIYMHDGLSKSSICDKRVRNYIFSGIDKSKISKCFVHLNKNLEEIYFCYHSGDDLAVFTDGDFCNRAAVYNYRSDTWSFMDLPNTVSGGASNVNTVETYTNTTLTYKETGGTYHEQESQFAQFSLMVSRAYTGAYETISTNRVVGIDLVNKGNLARLSISEFNFPMVAERVGIDLDEAQIPLSGYKVINRIYPQASTVSSDPEIYFEFGATNLATEVTNFNPGIVFNMATEYKVDTRMSGRYLSYKVGTATPKDFALSGFDIDLQIVGRR